MALGPCFLRPPDLTQPQEPSPGTAAEPHSRPVLAARAGRPRIPAFSDAEAVADGSTELSRPRDREAEVRELSRAGSPHLQLPCKPAVPDGVVEVQVVEEVPLRLSSSSSSHPSEEQRLVV